MGTQCPIRAYSCTLAYTVTTLSVIFMIAMTYVTVAGDDNVCSSSGVIVATFPAFFFACFQLS